MIPNLDLKSLAETYGTTVSAIKRWVESEESKTTKRDSASRQKAIREMASQGIYRAVCNHYYKRREPMGKMFLYHFYLNQNRIETGTVTKHDWLQLNSRLGPESGELTSGFEIPKLEISSLGPLVFARLLSQQRNEGETDKEKIWNDAIYRLIKFEPSESNPKIVFQQSDFYSHRFGNGLLEDELIEAYCKCGFNSVELMRRCEDILVERNKRLPDIQSLLNLETRVCAGGIALVFAIARPAPYKDFYLIIQRRSNNVSGGRGLLTVVPKAYHQPSCNSSAEVSIYWTAFREIYEELFGGQEMEARRLKKFSFDFYLRKEPMVWFSENPDKFDLEMVSLGLDTVCGNYDFGLLLTIRDEKWYRMYWDQMIPHEWESSGKHESCSTKDSRHIERLLLDPSWAGESLFSFTQALQSLRSKHPERVSPLQFWQSTGAGDEKRK